MLSISRLLNGNDEDLQKKFRKAGITAKKTHGDDAASWSVFIGSREFVNGLTRSEVSYYKKRALESLK